MKKSLIIILFLILALPSLSCMAQRFSVSTNLLGYAAMGTLNVEGSYSLSRRFSLTAGAIYNPFTFREDSPEQIQLRQRSFSLGCRIWPWHTWSGWWFAAKGRYQEYNFGGLISPRTDEGDRYGMGIYAGYTHMLAPHLNMEFGLGAWAGLDDYRTYSCQDCGITVGEGRKTFILPDDVMIALVYVF